MMLAPFGPCHLVLAIWLALHGTASFAVAAPASAQLAARYAIEFHDAVSEPDKIQYTKNLEQEISQENMDILTVHDEIFLVYATLTSGQLEEWHTDIISSIRPLETKSRVKRDNEWSPDISPPHAFEFPDIELDSDIEVDSDIELDYDIELDSDISKRDGGTLVRQDDPLPNPEVRFFSQPKGVPLSNTVDFTYRREAGSGVRVYIHDDGVNFNHKEFTWEGFRQESLPKGVEKGARDWLYPKIGNKQPKPTSDPIGHGTCVADKVAGVRFGIAKGADLTIVPIHDGSDEWMWAGWTAMAEDIKQRQMDDTNFFPVIVMPYALESLDSYHVKKYNRLFKKLVDLDAVIVPAAGNIKAGRTDIDYPARFVKYYPNVIPVVGLTDEGRLHPNSKSSPLFKVGAPRDVECARHDSNTATRIGPGGSSYAAPAGGGLAAYLISVFEELRTRGTVAQKVAEKIWTEASYERAPGSPGSFRGIWNLEESDVECL